MNLVIGATGVYFASAPEYWENRLHILKELAVILKGGLKAPRD